MADTHCDNDGQEIGLKAPATPGGSLVTPQTREDDNEANGANFPPGMSNSSTGPQFIVPSLSSAAIATKPSPKTSVMAAATATSRLSYSSTSADRRSPILTEREPLSTSSLAPDTLSLHSRSMTSSPGVEQASSEVSFHVTTLLWTRRHTVNFKGKQPFSLDFSFCVVIFFPLLTPAP